MSTFARATILTLLCGIAACLDGAGVPTSQTADQSINGTTVLPATGWGDLGVTSTSATDGSVTWCCTTWFTPLSLGVGDSVGSLTVPVRDNGSANGFAIDGNNVIIVLTAQSSSGSTVLGSVTSNGSGNPQTLTLTLSTGYTVPTGVSLVVKAIALAGGAIPGPALHPSMIGGIIVQPASTCIRSTHTRKLMPFAGQSVGAGIFQTQAENFAGVWQPTQDGDFLGISLPVEAGERIDSITADILGSVSWNLRMEAFAMDSAVESAPLSLGSWDAVLSRTEQTALISTTENVADTQRAYWLQFVAHLPGAIGFSPRVGPVVVRTSALAPGCSN